MPVVKLTVSEILKAVPINGREALYRDKELSGFSLKVTPANKKTFVFQYRIGGRGGIGRKIKIGNFPSIKPDEARKLALGYAGDLAHNIDPQEHIYQKIAAKLKSQENSFGRVFEDYAAEQLSQNRSGKEVKQIFERQFLPKFRERAIDSIERDEISREINRIAQKTPYAANRALSHIKTFFRWALGDGRLRGDPISIMKKPFKGEIKRDRVLTPKEIGLVWSQFEKLGCRPFGDALKVLFLTAQRRDEVGTMRWEDLDLENGLWVIPSSSSKNKLPHAVPLLGKALEIVKGQTRLVLKNKETGETFPSPYVFTTTGVSPISGWSKAKTDVENALAENKTPIKDWRFHDLRRTASTNLGDMGFPDEEIGMLLNHHSRGVTAIYNRSKYLKMKQKMLEKWERRLLSLVE